MKKNNSLLLVTISSIIFFMNFNIFRGKREALWKEFKKTNEPPRVTIISGPTASIITNRPFTIKLSVNKNYGYWSTNNNIFHQFLKGTVTINIANSTILKYYGKEDDKTSSIKQVQYTVIDRLLLITNMNYNGPANDITTNQPFFVNLSIYENTGYWSMNGYEFHEFTSGTVKIYILQSSTLRFYVKDSFGNTSSTQIVNYTISKHKIPALADGCFLGVFVDTEDYSMDRFGFETHLPAYHDITGKRVSILHQFIGWNSFINNGNTQLLFANSTSYDQSIQSECDDILSKGCYPMITWEPNVSHSEILSGNFDNYISSWASQISSWGKPLFLRLMHEMNLPNNDYKWVIDFNGNTTNSYINTWKYIIDKFNQTGATNVTWVWCPNEYDPRKIKACYPGDDYVDWIGLDGYNWGNSYPLWPSTDRSFTNIFYKWEGAITSPLEVIQSFNTTKPIMIAEWGCAQDPYLNTGNTKAHWIQDAFNALKTVPIFKEKVRAVIWFHKLDGDGKVDFKVNVPPEAGEVYKNAVMDNYFLGTEY